MPSFHSNHQDVCVCVCLCVCVDHILRHLKAIKFPFAPIFKHFRVMYALIYNTVIIIFHYPFSSRIRWSPLIRAELLKTPDNKLPCQIMIVAVGAAAAGW